MERQPGRVLQQVDGRARLELISAPLSLILPKLPPRDVVKNKYEL